MPMNERKPPPFAEAVEVHEAWWCGLDYKRRTQIMFDVCGGDLGRMPDTADEWWEGRSYHDRVAVYQWYGLNGGARNSVHDPDMDDGPTYARGGFFEDPFQYLANIAEPYNNPRVIGWVIAGFFALYVLIAIVIPIFLALLAPLLDVLAGILGLFILFFIFWAPGAIIEYLDRELKRGQQRRHDRQTIGDIHRIKDLNPRE